MKYIGEELENFKLATFWRKYTLSFFKQHLKNKKVAEVGSGVGSFSEIAVEYCSELNLIEPDKEFAEYLKHKFKNNSKINKIVNGTSKDLENQKFDAILHLQVLEHIVNDQKEIDDNLNLLNNKGKLLIIVPAFMSLYSNFDKAIGHVKRYEKKDFNNFELKKSKIIKMIYIDSCGYLLYKLFKLIINRDQPSKWSIIVWDKIFIPLSKIFDFIFRYKFGKNLIIIIEKND